MAFSDKQTKAASLKEIAKAAGVSETTVSRALSGKGELAQKTRDHVIAVARQCNWQDNRLVRGFQTGRTHMIGVLVKPIGEYSGRIFEGLHNTLLEHDCVPIVLFADDQNQYTELELLKRLIEYRVDGILIVPSLFKADDSYFKDAWDRGLPITCIDGWMCETHTDLATFDNDAGGQQAAKYLLDKGHRHIAQICGPHFHPVAIDRAKGFEAVLKQAGVDCLKLESVGFAHIADALENLLKEHPEITAIFAANDTLGVDVYQVCQKLGKQIPQDISVIGFADLAIAQKLEPALTTIKQDAYTLGCEAAKLLFRRLDGKANAKKPEAIYLPVQLIERESVRDLKQ